MTRDGEQEVKKLSRMAHPAGRWDEQSARVRGLQGASYKMQGLGKASGFMRGHEHPVNAP
jgi:hypothetical protein